MFRLYYEMTYVNLLIGIKLIVIISLQPHNQSTKSASVRIKKITIIWAT